MSRPPSAVSILKNLKKDKRKFEPKTPIATDMFIPNHSGDLSRGKVNTTPTQDLNPVNKKYVDDNIHSKQHAINDAANHTSPLDPGQMIMANVITGLPNNATNTNVEVAGAVNHSTGDGSDHANVATNTAASHAQSHTVASHNDTTGTGAELDELTDGSETVLHSHAGGFTPKYINLYRITTFDMPANNTWYDYPWNIGATIKSGISHNPTSNPEQLTILTAGIYSITYNLAFINSNDTVVRLLDDGTEIPGSYKRGVTYSSGYGGQVNGSIICTITANSVIELQVGAHNAGGDIFGIAGWNSPLPTTKTIASITIHKIAD